MKSFQKRFLFICLFLSIGFQASPAKSSVSFPTNKDDLISIKSGLEFLPELAYAKGMIELFLDCLQAEASFKENVKNFLILASIVNLNCFLSIFIHEVFGHYLIGRFFGLKPNKVSTGRGWSLLSTNKIFKKIGIKQWKTDFELKFLPSGGENSVSPFALGGLTDSKKILYFLAGPAANLISGLLVKKMMPKLLARIKKIKNPKTRFYLQVWLEHFVDQSILSSWFNLIPLGGMDGAQIWNTVANHRGPWKWS